jgi:O-antigen ligase
MTVSGTIPSVPNSHGLGLAVQSLALSVALGWFLGEPRTDSNTTVLLLFLVSSAVFLLLTRSTAQRLAWTLALQMFSIPQTPLGGIFVCLPDLLSVFLLFDLYRQRPASHFSVPGLAAIGLLLTACISTASSPVMSDILGTAIRYAIVLLLFIGLDRVQFQDEELHLIRVAMALSVPVGLIVLYFNGDLAQILLAVESGGRPLHSQILPLLGTLVFPWLILRRTRILTLMVVACLFAAATWMGRSRGMLVAAGATLLIVFATRVGRDLTALLISGLVTVAALLAAYSTIDAEGFADMMSVPESDEARLHKVAVSLDNFRRFPIWGMGPGSESQMTRRQSGDPMASENGLVESLAESGLVGTILFMVIALSPLRRCYSLARRRIINKNLAGAVLVMMVTALAPLTFSSSSKSVLSYLVLAVVNKHLCRAAANGPSEA